MREGVFGIQRDDTADPRLVPVCASAAFYFQTPGNLMVLHVCAGVRVCGTPATIVCFVIIVQKPQCYAYDCNAGVFYMWMIVRC